MGRESGSGEQKNGLKGKRLRKMKGKGRAKGKWKAKRKRCDE